MQRLVVLILLLLAPSFAVAGKRVTYDLVTFTPPAPWKKTAWTKDLKKDKNSTSYTLQNSANRTYCQIFIVKSTVSTGSLDADFASEWKSLVELGETDTVADRDERVRQERSPLGW